MRKLLPAATAILAVCVVIAMAGTARWPQISDDDLMHYVVLLMRHGMAPYRQIIDLNMPGSYLLDWAWSSVFGSSHLAWRWLDWSCLIIAGIAMVAVVGRRHWRAGCFAGALFALWHIGDGVAQADQRDYLVSILLLVSLVCLLRGIQKAHPAWMLGWGFACGAAATLKPQTMLLLPLLAAVIMWPRVAIQRRWLLLLFGVSGWALPLVCVASWLHHWHAVHAFGVICRSLIPYHAGMARHSSAFLIAHLLPGPLLLLLLPALAAWASSKPHFEYRERVLAVYLLFGAFSYWVQGKAYPYHRYPLLIFFFLWIGLLAASTEDLGQRTLSRVHSIAVAAMLLYGTLWLGPALTVKSLRWNWQYAPSLQTLTTDLTGLAGGPGRFATLQHQVQCLDTMAGCVTVLYRMGLVQDTGFLYDCYFFAPNADPIQEKLRNSFLAAMTDNPPSVIIVTDQWCFTMPTGYTKLRQWPAFDEFLRRRYGLLVERQWPPTGQKYLATNPFGYRIYVRHEAVE